MAFLKAALLAPTVFGVASFVFYGFSTAVRFMDTAVYGFAHLHDYESTSSLVPNIPLIHGR
jgi:hypothetical protein